MLRAHVVLAPRELEQLVRPRLGRFGVAQRDEHLADADERSVDEQRPPDARVEARAPPRTARSDSASWPHANSTQPSASIASAVSTGSSSSRQSAIADSSGSRALPRSPVQPAIVPARCQRTGAVPWVAAGVGECGRRAARAPRRGASGGGRTSRARLRVAATAPRPPASRSSAARRLSSSDSSASAQRVSASSRPAYAVSARSTKYAACRSTDVRPPRRSRARLLARELADRLEHREPLAAAAQQAVVDERRERLEHVVAADRLRGVEREAAGEDREPREEPARVVVEQVDAPLDRRAQRALALGDVARAARQQRQPLLEPREDRGRAREPTPAPRRARSPAAGRRAGGRAPRSRAPPRRARARRTARRRRRREAAAPRRRARRVRRSGARLVASTTTSGPASRTPATCGAASSRCSRLSSTRSMRRAPSSRARLWPLSSFTPSAPAIIDGTRSASVTAARPTKNAPSGKSGASSSATAEREARLAGAARPGQRDEPRPVPNELRRATAISSVRPISGDAGRGRFEGAVSDRGGAKFSSSSSATTW